MTEYTTSSQAIREYMSSRERTAYWVQTHTPEEFYSPSAPPSELDGPVPSSPPSDAGSSHSLPPKMVLRYGDGRPDIPLPYPQGGAGAMNGTNRSGSRRHYDGSIRARSGSHGSSPLSRSHSRRHEDGHHEYVHHQRSHRERSPPRVPEEIRVLPSHGTEPPLTSSSSYHHRSKSLPRTSEPHLVQPEVPFIPPPQPPSHHSIPPSHSASTAGGFVPGGQVTFAQQQSPQWDPRSGRMAHPRHVPPPIVYAPSQHSSRLQYTPPAMYHHPPQMGPNGMIYSHSAPVPRTQQFPTPYPSAGPSSHHEPTVHEERRSGRSRSGSHKRDRSRSMAKGSRRNRRSPSSSSKGSVESGSTYYVLPAAGQKVHVIAPSPEQSIHTATSTTKSATSPHSPSFKRPFFQRLFSFAGKFSSSGSTKGSVSGSGRRLQRRHSTGASGRSRMMQQQGHPLPP
ncbi:hypothetical protein BDQ12DRAFT_699624 [Crucibulum laeve]|uniref:Uncharacterized protein n=1 Tax=Crucibulum laeve TaxID=68775 RepID=A0A5C3LU63_9AGAR|nr:hypothetical protein BDQ12DRAFT_699624 [Crucibulum laeve]